MNDALLKILKHPATIPSIVGMFSFGAGVGTGWFIRNRSVPKPLTVDEQLELLFPVDDGHVAHFIDLAQNSIPFDDNDSDVFEANNHVTLVDLPSEETESDTVHDLVNQPLGGMEDPVSELDLVIEPEEPEEPKEPEPLKVRSVFAETGSNWNYQAELEHRATDPEVYVIHQDEYSSQEYGYPQVSLCYYEADNVMVDDNQQPIFDYPSVTGQLRFGDGTNDKNVFFVRNTRLEAEYEIIRDEGSYAFTVLGLQHEEEIETELSHSAPRRFRPE